MRCALHRRPPTGRLRLVALTAQRANISLTIMNPAVPSRANWPGVFFPRPGSFYLPLQSKCPLVSPCAPCGDLPRLLQHIFYISQKFQTTRKQSEAPGNCIVVPTSFHAMLFSILSSNVALNARSAVLTTSNAHRAPSVSMKSVPALETKFVYESAPDSLGKTSGGVTGLLDATGAVVSTGAAVSTGKTVPAMETDFVYKSESLGRTMGLVLGASPVAATTAEEEEEPTRSTGKAVPAMETNFVYKSESLGKTMGLVLNPPVEGDVSAARKSSELEAMEGTFVYGEPGRWSGA